MLSLRKILVATDFSESADNALEYAAGLAERTGASLTLLHAYHVPVVASEVPTLMFTLGEMEKEGLDELHRTENELRQKFPRLGKVNTLCLHGFVVETIESQVEKLEIDMVVMGLQGSGFFSEKVIGSNSDAVARRAKFPVLIINHHCRFRDIKRILLASDNKEIRNHHVLDTMRNIAQRFRSQVHILHVSKKENHETSLESAVEGLSMDRYLEGIEHYFFEENAPELMVGINNFNRKKDIDLTVALARRHGFFESFFHKDHVHSMVYHSNTPILILHESSN
ncbi:MAG TPA: universal stress protein [Bacteroidia bacterium]|nr:universal stress protein [Bacteroidia bacterium]